MSSEPILRVNDISKCYLIYHRPEDRLRQMIWRRKKFYQEYWALRNISFEVNRGEAIGIIGRNGSGKSTLLQIITGTLAPTSGNFNISGRVAALLELGAGFNPEFTGSENIRLAASILGLDNRQIAERFDAIVDFAGLGDFINQPVKIYSSGMYARLAFAVCAHVDADILIVDEILAVGDAAFTQKCMRFIRRFKQERTMFLVSHDINSVLSLCDRALWIDSGIVREFGPTKDVCQHYMAAIEGAQDTAGTFRIGGERKQLQQPVQDVRADLLRENGLVTTAQVFDFDSSAPQFGHGGAEIVDVALISPDGQRCKVIEAGNEVILAITCQAKQRIENPIAGFFVKDRLGQNLFGDNTFLNYRNTGLIFESGTRFIARFRFQMPYLPTGDFSITAAIAEGLEQTAAIQHHWIDDALLFQVTNTHLARGLIGVPMLEIDLRPEPLAMAAPLEA